MYSNLYEGYQDRMKNMAVQAALFNRVKSSRKVADSYDMLFLTISVMLYIYDGMLESNFHSPDNIRDFLRDIIQRTYKKPLSAIEAEGVSNIVLYDILQREGAESGHSYTEPFTGEQKNVAVRFLAMPTFINREKASYKLSSQGLMFLYQTREFQQELQITIEQFYVRQNIKNKKYNHALHNLDNILLLLRGVQAEFDELELKCKTNILQVTHKEIKKLHDQATSHYEMERESFENLIETVRQSIAEIERAEIHLRKEIDEEAIYQLKKIEDKLRVTTAAHARLLEKDIRLYQVVNTARREFIALGISKRVNYRTDVLDPMIVQDIAMQNSRYGFHYLFLSKQKSFNPLLKAFAPQPVRAKPEPRTENTELGKEVDNQQVAQEKTILKQKYKSYLQYLKYVVIRVSSHSPLTVSDMVAGLKEEEKEIIFGNPYFYAFFLDLHQNGIVFLEEIRKYQLEMAPEDSEIDFLQLFLEVGNQMPELFTKKYFCVRAVNKENNRVVIETPFGEFSDLTIYLTDNIEEVVFSECDNAGCVE